MIHVQNVYKNYGQRAAIKDLSFEIKKGEIVGFLGPNGAGKTTTMKMLSGFMKPSHGKIIMAGLDIATDPIEVKKKIGYLPETPPVYLDMTVRDYLSYVADLKGVSKADKNKNIDYVLESLKLTDVNKRLIQNLSKGFRQRVGIAQALVSNPEILILDEPTVGLDPKQVSEFRSVLNNLKGNHTIILSTHILSEVEASCERVIIINKGKIVAQNTIEALTQYAKEAKGADSKVGLQIKIYLRVSRPSESFKKKLESESYIKSVLFQSGFYEILSEDKEKNFESIAQLVMDQKVGFQELRKEHLQLEDVFVKLTQATSQNELTIKEH